MASTTDRPPSYSSADSNFTDSRETWERSPSPSGRTSSGTMEGNRPRVDTIHLTPYSQPLSSVNHPYQQRPSGYEDGKPTYQPWSHQDPRSSSMHSLRPVESAGEGRRTLLMIYIHGFMGNETSFRSFPAHVHNLLTITLAGTHVVHTKIYPKYKSKRAIEFARDDFSNWLCPHESPQTDVVLLGHSMGGILSTEVALLSPYSPANPNALRHRILGTISFDTPFLGMHPGVIVSGIGSLFRAAPPPPVEPDFADTDQLSPAQTQASDQLTSTSSLPSSPYSTPSVHDPYFDPPFPNDIRMQQRSGWENAMHFMSKHSDGLTRATKQYVMSHLEFGGCLADYPGLRRRYDRIRGLEDIDMHHPPKDQSGHLLRRVRFVNYYTASTGRLKAVPAATVSNNENSKPVEIEMKSLNLSAPASGHGSRIRSRDSSRSPRISIEEHRDGQVVNKEVQDPDEELHDQEEVLQVAGDDMRSVSPRPESDAGQPDDPPQSPNVDTAQAPNIDTAQSPNEETPSESAMEQSLRSPSSVSFMNSLPPIPAPPQAPPEFDPAPYTDKDTLKLAKKEHARLVKAYERSKKDREKAIKDRQKLIEKREKAAMKEQSKQSKLQKKQEAVEEKEKLKRQATLNPEAEAKQIEREKETDAITKTDTVSESTKKLRDRKFCVLPGKGRDGKRDPKWVRVFMEGVDEVGAHCGLFFMSETYERLVGDVAEKVEEWLKEDSSAALIWEEEEKKVATTPRQPPPLPPRLPPR